VGGSSTVVSKHSIVAIAPAGGRLGAKNTLLQRSVPQSQTCSPEKSRRALFRDHRIGH
jgi:hypothetical protein